jgi:hypothetical protein
LPYILWVELQQFYVDRAESAVPLVITRDKVVLDANRLAFERGIQIGISVKQAKALLQGDMFKPWKSDEYEVRSRAWLDLCVDFSGVIEPADQHAAWIDLSLHPNPVDISERMIRVLSQKTGLKLRFGAAPSKWIACLSAKHDDCGLASRDPKAFLASLRVTDLLPVSKEHRDRLQFLGYHTIGEVAELSLPTLQSQFEQSALVIHGASHGRLKQGVQALYPPSSVSDSLIFEGTVESLETIHQACGVLSRRLGERLSARSMQSGKLCATLELEDGSFKPISRVFSKPLRCPRSVHAALRLLLDPVMTEPIVSIRIHIPDLEKVRQFQPSLMEGSVAKGEPRVEAAMRYVQSVFGDKAVQLGKEIELPRRMKVLREWKNATGWR